jgi:hypothetical protein
MLEQVATIVTPDTILRWRRELVAAKWDYSGRRKKIGRSPASGRPNCHEISVLYRYLVLK